MHIQKVLLSALGVPAVSGTKFPPAPPPPKTFDNQSSSYSNPGALYDDESWTLYTNELQENWFSVHPYTANGYIGARIPIQGQGYTIDKNLTNPGDTTTNTNTWPIFHEQRWTGCFVSGFWGQDVIASVPTWTGLTVTDDKNDVFDANTDIQKMKDYYQGLSIRNGIVTTKATWNDRFDLNYTVVAHRNRQNLGMVRLDIRSKEDTTVILTNMLDGNGSWRTITKDSGGRGNDIWTAVWPTGLTNLTQMDDKTYAYEYATVSSENGKLSPKPFKTRHFGNSTTVSQQFELYLSKGEWVTVVKYVGVGSTDYYRGNVEAAAKTAAQAAQKDGWNKLIKEHTSAWDSIWDDGDIEIPGKNNRELQISTRASLYHLTSALREGVNSSVGVGGLSSDTYGQFAFWDADTWMSPGIQLLHPSLSKSFVDYRSKLESQAKANAQSRNYQGANIPWITGRYGDCGWYADCWAYEYHINVDVAQNVWNYYQLTKDKTWLSEEGWPILENAANFFASFVYKNGSFYMTHNLTEPDEYVNNIDNGAYTNAGIYQVMHWAINSAQILNKSPPNKWLDVADHIYVASNDTMDLTLEYSGMPLDIVVKQADVTMITYPLEWPKLTQSRAVNNLDFYSKHQTANGPAMTYSNFAVVASQLLSQGCSSYTYLLHSVQPYLRQPFYQFSEQQVDNPYFNGNNGPGYPFLTGSGGYLQVWTHGFTGFRANDSYLILDPSLPPQLEQGYTIKGLKYQGGTFDVNVTPEQTKVTARKGSAKVSIGSRNKNAGIHELKQGQTLTVATFRADLNGTVIEGNIAQCKPVTSSQGWAQGYFPLAINDGDNATYWQPIRANEKSAAIISLDQDAASFSHAYFLFGSTPPKTLSLSVSDDESKWTTIFADKKVDINSANTTTFTFDNKYTSKYVKIEIQGTYGDEALGGGIIAEVAFY